MGVYPDSWDSTSAYSEGSTVEYVGVAFRSLSSVAAGSEGSPNANPRSAPTVWEVVGVVRMVDHYSIIQASLQAVNTGNEVIEISAPLYLQIAEQEIYQRVHPPVERTFITLTAAADGTILLPNNINQFVHVRRKADTSSNGEHVEIIETDTTRFYQAKNQTSNGFIAAGLSYEQHAFSPIYIYDNKKMYFEGFEVEEGDEFELFVELALPALGITITDPADNTDKVVTSNWYATNAPRALYYGTNKELSLALKNQEGVQYWSALFEDSMVKLQDYIAEFESSDKTDQYQNSEYFD